jgi:colicin import membrane protein
VKNREYGPVSVTFAVFLHVALFGSMFVVFDFNRTPDFAMPLAINATLVTENAVITPPRVEEPKVVEPPKVEEPPPQPDTREQERIAAEQEKREQDARDETARLQKIEDDKAEAEKQRLAEAEKQRKEAAAEEERQRQLAEEERLKDIERQRIENERLRKEAEDTARNEELAAEAAAMDASEAIAANAKTAYIFAIQQDIKRNWVRPANAEVGLDCVISVRQTAGGVVTDVNIESCNGDATIRRSIEAAVRKASPLPAPRDPSVFDRDIRLTFRPEE